MSLCSVDEARWPVRPALLCLNALGARWTRDGGHRAGRWVLLPESTFRVTWDIVQTIFLIYIAIVAPIEYAFQLASPEGSFTHIMDLIIDGYFLIVASSSISQVR